jgi:glycerophosphoryl diester phosphodiesterase
LAHFFGWEFDMVSVVSRTSAVWMLMVAVFGMLILASLMSWSAGSTIRRPVIVAHRGGAAVAPENTLAAARQAIADGFDWIEIDVHESRDGQVMVIHDKDLKRVGKTERVVWATDAAELEKVDVGSWLAPKFKDERIPTLGQLLDVCKDKIGVIIELKQFHHGQRLEESVVEIVKQHGMQDQVMAMSFDAAIARKVKSLRPDWKVGWLTKEAVADPGTVDADFLGINHEHATPELIKAAHRRSLPVFVWTVNEPELAATIAGHGADAIITDNPLMVRGVLEKLGAAKQ